MLLHQHPILITKSPSPVKYWMRSRVSPGKESHRLYQTHAKVAGKWSDMHMINLSKGYQKE